MKKHLIPAACFLILLFVTCSVVWYAQSEAARTARMSMLLVLRQHVLACAEETGRYPDSIIDALPTGEDGTSPRNDQINNLVWLKSGQIFEPDKPALNELLFYEKEPTRYGFTKGRFEVYAGGPPVFRTD